jgi:predicted transcriptional regulator
MYYLPQEIETWYIIPALRRDISKCLANEFKVSYEKIGMTLGVSKAAISQYMKGKRASKIKLPVEISSQLMKSCKLMIDNKSTSPVEINRLLKFIRDKNLRCEICGQLKEGLLDDCKEIKYDHGNYESGDCSEKKKR